MKKTFDGIGMRRRGAQRVQAGTGNPTAKQDVGYRRRNAEELPALQRRVKQQAPTGKAHG